MSTELATKYLPYVDELFSQESKKSILTNEDFDFDGAKTVKLYKVNTAERIQLEPIWSRCQFGGNLRDGYP